MAIDNEKINGGIDEIDDASVRSNPLVEREDFARRIDVFLDELSRMGTLAEARNRLGSRASNEEFEQIFTEDLESGEYSGGLDQRSLDDLDAVTSRIEAGLDIIRRIESEEGMTANAWDALRGELIDAAGERERRAREIAEEHAAAVAERERSAWEIAEGQRNLEEWTSERAQTEGRRRENIEKASQGEYRPTARPIHPDDAKNLLTVFSRDTDGNRQYVQAGLLPDGTSVTVRDLGISMSPYLIQMMRDGGFPAEPESKMGKSIKAKFDGGLRDSLKEKIRDALYTFKSTEHDEAIKGVEEEDPSRPGLHERVINRATTSMMGYIQEIALDTVEINAMLTSDDPTDRKWALCEIQGIYAEAAAEYRSQMIARVEQYSPEQLAALGAYHARMAKDLGEISQRSLMGVASSPEQMFGLMLLGPMLGGIFLAPLLIAIGATAYYAVRKDRVSKKKGVHFADSSEIMAGISANVIFGESMLMEMLCRLANGESRVDIITKHMPEAMKRNASVYTQSRNRLSEVFRKYGSDKTLVVGSPEWGEISKALGGLGMDMVAPSTDLLRMVDQILHSLYRDTAFIITAGKDGGIFPQVRAEIDPKAIMDGNLTEKDMNFLKTHVDRYNETVKEITVGLSRDREFHEALKKSDGKTRARMLAYALLVESGNRYYCSDKGLLGSNASTSPALINGILDKMTGDKEFWNRYSTLNDGQSEKTGMREEWLRRNAVLLEDLRARFYPPGSWERVEAARQILRAKDPAGSDSYKDWANRSGLLSLALVAGMKEQFTGRGAEMLRSEFGTDPFSEALMAGDVFRRSIPLLDNKGNGGAPSDLEKWWNTPDDAWGNDKDGRTFEGLEGVGDTIRTMIIDASQTLSAQLYNGNALRAPKGGGEPSLGTSKMMEHALAKLLGNEARGKKGMSPEQIREFDQWLKDLLPPLTEADLGRDARETAFFRRIGLLNTRFSEITDATAEEKNFVKAMPQPVKDFFEKEENRDLSLGDLFEGMFDRRLMSSVERAGRDFDTRSLVGTVTDVRVNMTSAEQLSKEKAMAFVKFGPEIDEEMRPDPLKPDQAVPADHPVEKPVEKTADIVMPPIDRDSGKEAEDKGGKGNRSRDDAMEGPEI